jgi:putative NADH-flavin reductase
MRLTVFGATGAIGGILVDQAIAQGHEVTAVVRDAGRFGRRHDRLTIEEVPDLTAVDALLPAVKDRDAVLSGIGPKSAKDVTVASSTGLALIRALDLAGVRRFVWVSAAPVGGVPDGDSLFNRYVLHPLVSRALRGIYGDMASLEDALLRSDLDWTVVRPPRLTNGPLTATYRTAVGANVPKGLLASRRNVADCMLRALSDPAMSRQAVGVAD